MQKEEIIFICIVPVQAKQSNTATFRAKCGEKSAPANGLLPIFLRMTQVYAWKVSLDFWTTQSFEPRISPSLPWKHYQDPPLRPVSTLW